MCINTKKTQNEFNSVNYTVLKYTIKWQTGMTQTTVDSNNNNNVQVQCCVRRNPEPKPDLVHATGCKQPSLRIIMSWSLRINCST
jgi:hypothetical protein